MDAFDFFNQVVFIQGGGQQLNVVVTGCSEGVHCAGVNPFQQQNTDAILSKRYRRVHLNPLNTKS